jgi:hypothetical protein
MALIERIVLEFFLIAIVCLLLWEAVCMWRDWRRERRIPKELWQVLYEQGMRDQDGKVPHETKEQQC